MAPMTPDMLTIPAVPESTLKAIVQSNALLHAAASASCFAFRATLTKALGLPSPLFIVTLAFAFAFHAAFLFRVSIKEPLPRPLVIASALINLTSALLITVILILHVLNFTTYGARLLTAGAVLHIVVASALLFFSLHSSYSYSPAQVISL